MLSITRTNMGLNLSELTNSVTMVILDEQPLPFDVFLKVLSWSGSHYPIQQMPIMVLPADYLQNNNFPYDRMYNLWVLKQQKWPTSTPSTFRKFFPRSNCYKVVVRPFGWAAAIYGSFD